MGKLIKALAVNENVRIYICDTTDIVEYARNAHGLWPTASAALGRVLSVACMMGSNLKSKEEKITITINGGGPIGTIMTDADCDGNVRGFVANPEVHYEYHDLHKLAVGVAVGKDGYLEVKKNMGLKEDFNGKVNLQSGEIGDDFAYYFAVSEQTPSLVSVGVLVDSDNSIISAGGLLIQMLPGASEEDISTVEQATKDMTPMSELIQSGKSLTEILNSLFKDVKILDESNPVFKCNCSREKMEAAISTLETKDIVDMIKEDHGCEITCQFCKKSYKFNEDDLNEILKVKKAS